MKKVIIGSTAIKYYFPDFNRCSKDIDYAVASVDNLPQSREIEYLLNPVILKYQDEGYLSPNLLVTLKASHLFWDINWSKHIFDLQFLLEKGCVIDITIMRELRAFWETILPQVRRSNLALNKEEFFTNAINYDEHEHDILHTYLHTIPAYTLVLADGKEVELDESKFHALSNKDKDRVVCEEVMVMAYERYKNMHHQPAFSKMLKKCIMSHFPEYIALYAIENHKRLHKAPFNFIEKINTVKYESVIV